MIVKNEGENLGRILSGTASLVNEIIVVDTGSTDNTVEIALKYGAKLFFTTWQDDFAAARNFSLEKAAHQWILCLDADEELIVERDMLHRLIEIPNIEGYLFEVVSEVKKNTLTERLRHPSLRLWRNRPSHRFKGCLHEEVTQSILKRNGQAQIKVAPVTIRHYGYQEAEKRKKDKSTRNIRILEQACKREPDNMVYKYNLAIEFFQCEKLTEAADLFEEAFRHIQKNWPGRAMIIRNYSSCLLELQRYEKGLMLLQQGSEQYPDYTDLFYLQALIFAKMQRYEQAIEMLNFCLDLGEPPCGYISLEGVGGYLACFQAGRILEAIGEKEQAIKSYTIALQMNSEHIPSLYGLVRVMVRTWPLDQCLPYLDTYFVFMTPRALGNVLEAFAEAGAARLGIKLIRSDNKTGPSTVYQRLLARAYLLREREVVESVLKRFGKIPAFTSRHQVIINALRKLQIPDLVEEEK
jgi:glycosyltransferase involved in cell wall biosynthesis